METTAIVKQVIGIQKNMFENSFNMMVMAQDQAENMIGTYLEQLPWVTAEGKKTVNESVAMGKKARADFKKAMDDGYTKIEEMVVHQVDAVAPMKKAA